MDDIVRNDGLHYIAKQIFEYLDFESLKSASKVSNLWNSFIMKERSLWLRHFDATRNFIMQKYGRYDEMGLWPMLCMLDLFRQLEKECSSQEIVAMVESYRPYMLMENCSGLVKRQNLKNS